MPGRQIPIEGTHRRKEGAGGFPATADRWGERADKLIMSTIHVSALKKCMKKRNPKGVRGMCVASGVRPCAVRAARVRLAGTVRLRGTAARAIPIGSRIGLRRFALNAGFREMFPPV